MIPKIITPNMQQAGRGSGDLVRYVLRAGSPEPLDCGAVNHDMIGDDRDVMAGDLAAMFDSDEQDYRQRGGRGGNPRLHMMVSWQDGEHPTPQHAEQVAQHMMKALGMQDCAAVWALHRDTDHDHVHLVINRIRPDGRMAAVPSFNYAKLHQAAREMELAQGWRHDQGAFVALDGADGPQIVRQSVAQRLAVPDRARQAEHHQGTDAFARWVAGEPASSLRRAVMEPGASWQTAHAALARYGVSIAPKGSGMIVTTEQDGGTVAAKASQLGRWASKAALEKRLGPFQAAGPSWSLPSALHTYPQAVQTQRDGPPVMGQDADPKRAAARAERAVARTALQARFAQEQAQARQARPAQRVALRQAHVGERQALATQLRQDRPGFVALQRSRGLDGGMVQSLWALHAATERERMQKAQAVQRRAVLGVLPKAQAWRGWLEQQAELGDEAARAALRGIRYREQRDGKRQQDGIEGVEVDPLRKLTVAALQAEIDQRRQRVIYRGQDGRERFTDTGPRIEVHDKAEDSLEAALRIAAQKYGGQVEITGSAAFREQAARQAVRLGIRVADADLQGLVQDEQNQQMRREVAGITQRERERERARRDAGAVVVPSAPAAAPAELSTAAGEKSARVAGKSLNVQAPAGVPAPRAGREAEKEPARQPGAPSRRSGRGMER